MGRCLRPVSTTAESGSRSPRRASTYMACAEVRWVVNPWLSCAWFTASFVMRIMNGSLSATRSAHATVSATKRSRGSTRLTRPHRSASAASMKRGS